jgi:selenide, water dikinase
LRGIAEQSDPNLLVGFNLADDAGVYRIAPDLALVQTVDIFTPVVDDAYDYGRIAAANSLSDIYAMGARPLTALNIAAFPRKTLPFEVLGDMLRGGLSKVSEAGATIVGGHTVENAEPLYGLAVTGLVHPERIATNAGARAGDMLVLTKPLGTGIVSTAIKFEACADNVARAAIDAMATLNRAACEAMIAVGIGTGGVGGAVHACTDVTGFGLMGHAAEMARGSGVALEIRASAIPLLPGVAELAANDHFVTGGGGRNEAHLADFIELPGTLPDNLRNVLFDPQTSGGLLIAVAEDKAGELLHELQGHGATGTVIGCAVAGAPRIVVAG